MRVTTAVITGACPEITPFILESAHDLLPSDDAFILLRYRGAEEALAHAKDLMDPVTQYTIRDILRTRAFLAWLAGAKHCLIMGCVGCNRGELGFDECEQFVLREMAEVRKWSLYGEHVCGACVTPQHEVVPLC